MNSLARGVAQLRRARWAFIALVALLLGLAAIPAVALWKAFGPSGNAAPDFTLVDQNGRPFTLSAQRGTGVVLFFGYTHCTDVCPATLAILASLERTLDDVRNRPEVALITVDPLHDSPPVLKRYLLRFDARFVGLTGAPAEIARIEAAYHTSSEVEPAAGNTSGKISVPATIVHGATLFFIDPRGKQRFLANWNDSRLGLAHDLQSIAE